MATGDCWFVFRRYTDFVRLYNRVRIIGVSEDKIYKTRFQLKTDFPDLELPLPRKRWFGDNFNPSFIHERTMGLQQFIDYMFKKDQLQLSMALREFFCLDEPPTAADGMDESRVKKTKAILGDHVLIRVYFVFDPQVALEALMDTLQQTRLELVEKELMLHTLKEALDHTTMENDKLKQQIRYAC
jgi:PX domain